MGHFWEFSRAIIFRAVVETGREKKVNKSFNKCKRGQIWDPAILISFEEALGVGDKVGPDPVPVGGTVFLGESSAVDSPAGG